MGDAVAEADPAPSEAQNYFAMLQETPSTLLPRLVAQWGCSDSTAERVASLLGSDLVSLHLPCLTLSHSTVPVGMKGGLSPVVDCLPASA